MSELWKVRCALCGARYWKDETRDDRGDLVVWYVDDQGRDVEICGCGHRLGDPAPRQPTAVDFAGREYEVYE